MNKIEIKSENYNRIFKLNITEDTDCYNVDKDFDLTKLLSDILYDKKSFEVILTIDEISTTLTNPKIDFGSKNYIFICK